MYNKDYLYDYPHPLTYEVDEYFYMPATPIRRKKVTLTSEDAHLSQNLGDGFTRRTFTRTIKPNTFYKFTYRAGNQKVISGGWWIAQNQSYAAYATSSYSNGPNEWIIVLHNPSSRTREAVFTFITKN
jgi:hypothetical protein